MTCLGGAGGMREKKQMVLEDHSNDVDSNFSQKYCLQYMEIPLECLYIFVVNRDWSIFSQWLFIRWVFITGNYFPQSLKLVFLLETIWKFKWFFSICILQLWLLRHEIIYCMQSSPFDACDRTHTHQHTCHQFDVCKK